MYQAPAAYREAIDNNQRGTFSALVFVDGIGIDADTIKEIVHTSYMASGCNVGIGNALVSSIKMTAESELAFENKNLEISIGMRLDDEITYVPVGKFRVDTVERNENTVTVTAYDAIRSMDIPYVSELTYPSSIEAVANEISILSSVEIAPGTVFPEITLESAVSGRTCREAMAWIAELMGCNVVADREGKADFRWFKETHVWIDADYRHYSFEKQENDYTLGSIACITGDTTSITAGEGKGISITNEHMTQEILDELLAKITMTYRGGSCSFLGDPTLEVGDIILVTDLSGAGYQLPIMEMTMTFDGGVKNDIRAYAETDTQVELNSGVSITKRIMSVEKNLDGITMTVAREYATKEYLQAQLVITAEEITSTVSQSLDGETLISKINQTAAAVSIEASKINLTGYTTFTDLEGEGSCSINGKNITAGILMSKNYLKRDNDGNLIYDPSGNTTETGEGTMLNLETGYTRFSGKYDYAWLDKPQSEHDAAIEMENGRVRIFDKSADASLYISQEGISTTADANEASGVLDFRSDRFGESAAGNEYKGLTVLTNGSPAALASKKSDIILAPHMEDRAGDNKFTFTLRENGDGALYYGKREYNQAAQKFTHASGLQFSSAENEDTIYTLNGAGEKGKAKLIAANIPKSLISAAVIKNNSGQITKLNCVMDDESEVTVSVSYDAAGNITKVGDTVFTY